MNRTELIAKLQDAQIRPDAYDISGYAGNETYVLRPFGPLWEVFYSERGSQNDRQTFATEDDACEHFLAWVTGDPTTKIG